MSRPLKALLLSLTFCCFTNGTINGSAKGATNPPVEVFADAVDVNINAQTTVFKGKVRILFSPYQPRCQQATVYLNPKTQKVQKIVMDGEVVVEKGTQILKGRRITLDVATNHLKIEGQVYTRFQFDSPVNLNLN